jgi:uncharacterized oxidoreductase
VGFSDEVSAFGSPNGGIGCLGHGEAAPSESRHRVPRLGDWSPFLRWDTTVVLDASRFSRHNSGTCPNRPLESAMPLIPAHRLIEFSELLLAAGGASREEASLVGKSLVGANLRGYDSHGMMRIPYYVDALAKGEVVSGAELAIRKETHSLIVADGNWGFGQVQARRLLERLMTMARDGGVAVGTMLRCCHVGRLGEYCEIAAADKLVTMVMVNSHGAACRMAPPGGRVPRLSTNPLAVGVPHADAPLVLDFSTSATAEGKVRVKRIAGERVPDGWLIDSQGRPTNDPNALYADPPGAILPMGGAQAYKGFGLGLIIDIFCGALSGGLCSREKPETQIGNCVYMQVLDPAQFGGIKHFEAEVAQLADFVRNCPRTEGVDDILLPGDPERRVLADRTAKGIPLDGENWAQLARLAERLKVPLPAV